MVSPHPESAAFLATIAANPDDDLPRLVYADWLDENGDPDRAEFIRVQCELPRMLPNDPRRESFAIRQRELVTAHRDRWRLPQFPDQHQVFHRGFVDRVETTAEWLRDHPASLASATMVRELRVVNAARVGMQLAHLPGLERLEHLDLTGNSTGPAFNFAAFLTDARLDSSKALTLGNCGLRPWHVQELVEVPVCGQLVRLALWGNPLSDEGVRHLTESPHFGNLQLLDLSSHEQENINCIHIDGAKALAASETLTNLRVLDLSDHYMGDDGLIALANSPNARSLERLAVAYNEIGGTEDEVIDSGIDAVVRSPHLGSMREFIFSGNRLSPLGAEALATWPHLERMRFVDLRECEYGDGGEITRERLMRSPWAEKFVL